MNDASNGIYAACSEKGVFVRVVGRGIFLDSQPLRQYGSERMATHKEFYVDLRECQSMDSTFLGVLAGFALKLRNGGCLHLLNVAEPNLQSIRNLGLDRVAQVSSAKTEPAAAQESLEFKKLCSS